MTSKRRHRSDRSSRNARESVRLARDAVEQVSAPSGDVPPLDLDPASALFFEFAAPLLMTARNEVEFQTASDLADFVWASTHFDAATQVLLLNDFIEQTGVQPELIPWLIEVYGELAARKAALVGE